MSFIFSFVFSSTKLEKRVEKVLPGSWGLEEAGRKVAQPMYMHVSK
jgi:hypothetical protein